MNHEAMQYSDFPCQSYDKIRFADTDLIGHVNNAVFSTFLETGRVDILLDKTLPILSDDCTFVIVSMKLDYVKEITWLGTAEIGTAITKIGNSTIHFYQKIFQNGVCVATASTVCVQMNEKTRKSNPLSEIAKTALEKYYR